MIFSADLVFAAGNVSAAGGIFTRCFAGAVLAFLKSAWHEKVLANK